MDLKQKNVAFVGGYGGIGSATCKRLIQKGVAKLAILDVAEKKELTNEFKALNPSAKVFFFEIDLLNNARIVKCIDEVIAKIGHVDILINGSGVFNEVNPEITIGINLLGLIHTTMAVLPKMDKSKGNRGGLIVNIASAIGLRPSAHPQVYSASKAGVIMYSRCLGDPENLETTGISCIAICPGMTQTPLWDQFLSEAYTADANEIKVAVEKIRGQTADDCAKSIIEAIEMNKNGAVYICDVCEIKEVSIPPFWDPQL